jgi:hypothetical protein
VIFSVFCFSFDILHSLRFVHALFPLLTLRFLLSLFDMSITLRTFSFMWIRRCWFSGS